MFALLVWRGTAPGVAFGGVSISDDPALAKKEWIPATPQGGDLYVKGQEVST